MYFYLFLPFIPIFLLFYTQVFTVFDEYIFICRCSCKMCMILCECNFIYSNAFILNIFFFTFLISNGFLRSILLLMCVSYLLFITVIIVHHMYPSQFTYCLILGSSECRAQDKGFACKCFLLECDNRELV